MKRVLLLIFLSLFLGRGELYSQYSTFTTDLYDLKIRLKKHESNDSLILQFSFKNTSKAPMFMGSFTPAFRWYLDSNYVWLRFGEDIRFWKESSYKLATLNPGETTYSDIPIKNCFSGSATILIDGHFFNLQKSNNQEILYNYDIKDLMSFRSFGYRFLLYPPK